MTTTNGDKPNPKIAPLEKELAELLKIEPRDDDTKRLIKRVRRKLRKLKNPTGTKKKKIKVPTSEELEAYKIQMETALEASPLTHFTNPNMDGTDVPFYGFNLQTCFEQGVELSVLIQKYTARWDIAPTEYRFIRQGPIWIIMLGPVPA